MNDSRTIKIGEWTVSPHKNLLERPGASIKLEPRAMDVLTVLARRAGDVVAVDELHKSVWKGLVVGDGSVYLAINQLRQALDDPNAETSHIETTPKRGYRLTAPVAFVDEPGAAPPPVAAPAARARTMRKARWLMGVAAAAGLVTACTWLAARFVDNEAEGTAIAVLPFDNLSTNVDQQYFADGITEEIINALTGIRDLKVTGSTSAFRFDREQRDLATIASVLGVAHVLEGAVRRAGDDVRVSVRLIDVGSGRHVWAHTYERRIDDAFAVQDEIARAVAAALQITLAVGDAARRVGMTRNAEAYDEYLRALSLHLRFERAALPRAVEHLERAVALDPTFSVAWTLLSSVCRSAAILMPERADEWRAKGVASLDRARSLTPDAPDVLVRSSIDLVERGRLLDAAAVHARAVSAFARSGIGGEAAAARGYLLLTAGRIRDAIAAFEQARAIDPLVPAYSFGLGNAYLAAADFDAAFDEVDRGLELAGLQPSLRSTALMTALARGDHAEIAKRLASLEESDTGAGVQKDLGALLEARAAAVGEIRHRAAEADVVEKANLAQWAAHFGEPELALELLADVPPPYLLANGTLWRPLLSEVRRRPEFKQIVLRLGLVDYWRVYGWSELCRPVGTDDFACT